MCLCTRIHACMLVCFFFFYLSFSLSLSESNTWLEMEVSKLETLLQSKVSVIASGEASVTEAAKGPQGLRRRKRNCSRRTGEREAADGSLGERGERASAEEKDKRVKGTVNAMGEARVGVIHSL